MYAAVRQYEIGSGFVADLIRILNEGLASTLAQQPGFVAYHVIATGSDEIVSVTIFEAEDGAIRSNQLAAEFVRERLDEFQTNMTAEMSGEVGVHRLGARALAEHPS
jgi:hypothetical protein